MSTPPSLSIPSRKWLTSARASLRFLRGFPLVARDADYRAVFVVLLLLGIAVGAVIPYVTLWATQALGVSILQAGLLFVPMSLVGLLVNLSAAAYSDHIVRRKPIILLSLAVGAGCRLALSSVDSYQLALVLFSLTGFTPFPFVFALLTDLVQNKTTGDQKIAGTITGTERLAFSLGWLVGPVLGGALIALAGYSAVFLVSGGLFAVIFALALVALRDYGSPSDEGREDSLSTRWLPEGFLMLFIAAVLIFTVDYARSMFVPPYITGPLNEPASLVGIAFTATVVAEIFFMPMSGYLADIYGARRIFLLGLCVQAFYFVLLGLSSAYWQVVLLQVLYAFVVSVSMGVGIVYIQSLYPRRTATATTAYLSAIQVAPLMTSLSIGSITHYLSFPYPFFAASAISLVAIGLFSTTKLRP